MRIAVPYENGSVFHHFGRTETFKIYEVEEDQIVSSELVATNGTGHGALSAFLGEQQVDLVICGGIGQGALDGIMGYGISVLAGADGDTDAVVEAYLKGELETAEGGCDHHGHGEGGCGHHDHEEGGCGGGCGGGCCGHHQPSFEGPNVGKTVRAHYRGTFNDGTQFDSSYDRGEPLEFVCGAGMMIAGFDKAVATMQVGEIVDVHLMPSEAYGEKDPNAIFTVELANLPGAEELNVGEQAYLQNMYGQPFPVVVLAKTADSITFDANHEMAGKELNFRIELVEVK